MESRTSYRFNYWWRKNFKRACVLILVVLILYFIYRYSDKLNIKDPGNAAFLGVIVGSFITGILTYFSTEIVKRGEIKKNEMKERKLEIYNPLYNDLVQFSESLKYHPYPSWINTNPSNKNKYISLSEWTLIKNDARYLAINKGIKGELISLYNKINQYESVKGEFNSNIYEIINLHVERKFGLDYSVFLPGNQYDLFVLILKNNQRFVERLSGTRVDKFGAGIGTSKIDEELATCIMYEASLLPTTIEFGENYKQIIRETDEIIKNLGSIIKIIDKEVYGKDIF